MAASAGIDRGQTFSNSVYRDSWRLVHSSVNTTGFTPAVFLTVGVVDAAILAARGGTLDGWLEMGPADGLELRFMGTNAADEAYNYQD